MRSIPASEAKARFSELLSDVERGETIAITRHGKRIAEISPGREIDREQVLTAIEELRQLRQARPKTGISLAEILEWRHEGHRY